MVDFICAGKGLIHQMGRGISFDDAVIEKGVFGGKTMCSAEAVFDQEIFTRQLGFEV